MSSKNLQMIPRNKIKKVNRENLPSQIENGDDDNDDDNDDAGHNSSGDNSDLKILLRVLVSGQNGAGGLENGSAELAPSVRRLGSHLEPVDGLLSQTAESRFGSVDEHAAGVVFKSLHEVAHFVHFYIRVRVVGRVPAQRQLGRPDVDDSDVGHAGRNRGFGRDGNVDELVLVGWNLVGNAVVGKDLESIGRDRIETADGHLGVVERALYSRNRS